MEVIHTETNRGNKCIVYNGFTYRKMYTLKSGDVVYRCSNQKNCKASVTTDDKGIAIIRTRGEHDHEGNEQKAEVKQIRVRVRKRSENVTSRPSKIIRQDLQVHGELTLQPKDLKNVALSLYRERRKNQPKLPKNRTDVQDARGNRYYLANGRGTM